jgi:hypothetical protein
VRLRVWLLALIATIVASVRSPKLGAQTPVRLATLPDARCDSTLSDSLADSTIVSLQSADVPPRLLSLIKPVPPSSLHRTVARTRLELVVDKTGKLDPCHVRVLVETAPAWTDAVLHALKKARYSPGQRYGLAVAVRFTQEFTATRP